MHALLIYRDTIKANRRSRSLEENVAKVVDATSSESFLAFKIKLAVFTAWRVVYKRGICCFKVDCMWFCPCLNGLNIVERSAASAQPNWV